MSTGGGNQRSGFLRLLEVLRPLYQGLFGQQGEQVLHHRLCILLHEPMFGIGNGKGGDVAS